MSSKEEVLTAIDDLKTYIVTIDQGVEALYDMITQLTNQGITPEVANQLLAKISEVRFEADKILVDHPAAPVP